MLVNVFLLKGEKINQKFLVKKERKELIKAPLLRGFGGSYQL
jgi:hypothetical protein